VLHTTLLGTQSSRDTDKCPKQASRILRQVTADGGACTRTYACVHTRTYTHKHTHIHTHVQPTQTGTLETSMRSDANICDSKKNNESNKVVVADIISTGT